VHQETFTPWTENKIKVNITMLPDLFSPKDFGKDNQGHLCEPLANPQQKKERIGEY